MKNTHRNLVSAAICSALFVAGAAFAQSGATATTTTAAPPSSMSTTAGSTAPTGSTTTSSTAATHGSAVSGTARTAATGSSAHGAAVSSVAHGVRDFKRLDLNGDGSLSSSEVASIEGLTFTDVDTDANLGISQAEYEAYLSSNATASTGGMDDDMDDDGDDADED